HGLGIGQRKQFFGSPDHNFGSLRSSRLRPRSPLLPLGSCQSPGEIEELNRTANSLPEQGPRLEPRARTRFGRSSAALAGGWLAPVVENSDRADATTIRTCGSLIRGVGKRLQLARAVVFDSHGERRLQR